MSFKGKTVAITGADGGIGQALCRHFASEGATIVAIDKRETVASFAAELKAAGVNASHAIADVGNKDDVALAFKAIGPVDVLVNNAGFSEHPTFPKTDPDAWAYDVNGNLNGAYNCAHAVIPGMIAKGGGSIVAIGSVNGLMGFGDPAYSAAKAGLSRSPSRSPWSWAGTTSAPTSSFPAR